MRPHPISIFAVFIATVCLFAFLVGMRPAVAIGASRAGSRAKSPFVQGSFSDPNSDEVDAITAAFTRPQTKGDMNIVVIGYNSTTATVTQVKDSAGNTYKLAIGPTTGAEQRQSIYYASNIKGGANHVFVRLSAKSNHPDMRILEYSGVSMLDKAAGTHGNSMSATSPSVKTARAKELVFVADTCFPNTVAIKPGYANRFAPYTTDGDIAADKIAASAGSCSAAATLATSNYWVIQIVTFH